LAFTFGGVLLALGNAVINNPTVETTPAIFQFPEAVPLSGWQFDNSRFTVSASSQLTNAVSGRDYHYRQNHLPLTVKMYYVTKAVNANDNKLLLQSFADWPSAAIRSLSMRQQPQTGFYQLSTDPKTAYLISCINPQGGSTITREQFLFNRNTADLQPQRILLWLQGRAPLRDNRCLWVLMSRPLQTASADAAYSTLETAWSAWYSWWKAHFPNA
jgi:cyanosortase A-associated protein